MGNAIHKTDNYIGLYIYETGVHDNEKIDLGLR